MDEPPSFLSSVWPPLRPTVDLSMSTYALLEAAGLVRRSPVSGVHTLLPLGLRVRDQIAAISRRAFERQGFGAVSFPALQSRSMWEESGRWAIYQDEGALFVVDGGSAGEMCLTPTSEEIAVATVRTDLRSYRDLPARLFLSTPKFRNEMSPRGGLMRAREFEMADAYTFDAHADGMGESVQSLNEACSAALSNMGLHGALQVGADGGSISNGPSTEHIVIADFGESNFLACTYCGKRGAPELVSGLFISEPDKSTTEPVVKVMVFAGAGGRVVAVMIRDDLHVSTRKVAATLGEPVAFLPADRIASIFDREPGTLNPWDAVKHSDVALFDESVTNLKRFTIADGSQLRAGVRWDGYGGLPAIAPAGRDLHRAVPGLRCGHCGTGRFEEIEAVELAHVFELGRQYSAKMGLRFAGADGNPGVPYMACSGIGITRCLQTIAGQFRDRSGLRWPAGVGPADVHVIGLRADQPEARERIMMVAQTLAKAARVIADDRHAAAGDKFTFASLLGVPCQIVVSPRQDPGEVELISRWTGRRRVTDLSQAVGEVKAQAI